MWDKIIVKSATADGIESIAAILINNGIVGMEIVDDDERVKDLKSMVSTWDYADESLLTSKGKAYVVFYVAKEDDSDKLIGKIESELKQIGGVDILREKTDESEWMNEWKKHFKPIKIGKIVIVPDWEAYEAKYNETVFRIDPGAAFGTGQHESTNLCVFALQEFVKVGDTVLDIGCGSGILSCISSLIGAKKVVACDIDPIGAISATKRNAKLNGISNIEVYAGDAALDLAEKLSEEKYDVVVANIVADVVIELTQIVKGFLKPDGRFISSGIIGARAADVKAKFKQEDLKILWQKDINDWHAFVVEKNA